MATITVEVEDRRKLTQSPGASRFQRSGRADQPTYLSHARDRRVLARTREILRRVDSRERG